MPGVLESQWIPTDPDLWRVDQYIEFLNARRDLLADAANSFLGSLLDGSASQAEALPRTSMVVDDEADDRGPALDALLSDLAEHAVVAPLRDCQVNDPTTGERLAIAEAYWPDGLQPGRGEPVVLELDPDDSDIERLQAIGFRVFTSLSALREFVAREAAADAGDPTSVDLQA